MVRVLLWPTVFLLILGIVGMAITSPASSTDKVLVFAANGQIHTLDTAGMTWMQDIRAAMGLWEGLLEYDPKTLQPVAGIARRWTVSPDGTKYTFYLRHTARWSNGDPVTARDFVFAWRRMLHPTARAGYVTMLFHIKGAEAYFNALTHAHGPRVPFSTVGIKAHGNYELVVTLARPCTYFLDLMPFPPFFPLNRRSMQPFAPRGGLRYGDYNLRWTHPPYLVTDGPYKLTQWRFGQYLQLEPNPYYWDRRAVRCSCLRLATYSDNQSQFLAYRDGEVQIVSSVPAALGPALLRQQREGLRHDLHVELAFGTSFLNFNCAKAPLNDPRLRLALALAINKTALVRGILRMGEKPVNVLVPPDTIAGYHSPKGLDENVALAKRLLAQAGYPDGLGLRQLTLLTDNDISINILIAEAIAKMWRANLGVRVRLVSEESKTYYEDEVAGNFDICRSSWYGDYDDPTTWLNLFRTGNSNNHCRFSDPKFDSLMRQAALEANATRRFALLQAAERILVDQQMPAAPLYQYSNGPIYNNQEIGGIYPNPRAITLLKYVHFRRAWLAHRTPPLISAEAAP